MQGTYGTLVSWSPRFTVKCEQHVRAKWHRNEQPDQSITGFNLIGSLSRLKL